VEKTYESLDWLKGKSTESYGFPGEFHLFHIFSYPNLLTCHTVGFSCGEVPGEVLQGTQGDSAELCPVGFW
jgi:hypothetical protein